MALGWKKPPRWETDEVSVAVWPITQLRDRALPGAVPIIFSSLNYEGLTPLIAFAVTGRRKSVSRESVFVMNLPMSGAPEDRADRALRSLIANGDNLIRHILFLLAIGDDESMSSGAVEHLIGQGADGAAWSGNHPVLLETMLRTLHRNPDQLRRVDSLLETLRKQPDSSGLLTPEFTAIWEPIWAVGKESLK